MNKSNMLRNITTIAALLIAIEGYAAGGGGDLEPADIDPGNIASLQRGARNFMNYCSGCHSAQYVRFNTIGKHLELSEEQLIATSCLMPKRRSRRSRHRCQLQMPRAGMERHRPTCR